MKSKGSTGGTKIGSRLRELRVARGMSLRGAAAKLGISYSRLREYELGYAQTSGRRAIPGRDVLARAADLYGFPAETLLALAGLPVAEPVPAPPPTEVRAEALEIAEIYERLPEVHQRLLLGFARLCGRDAGPRPSR